MRPGIGTTRLAALLAAAALAFSACGGDTATTPASDASPGTAGKPGDIASLPAITDPTAVLAGYLGVPMQPLDPATSAIRDQLLQEVGDAVKGPVKLPPAFSRVDARLAAAGSEDIGSAILSVTILGVVMPSQPAAEAAASIVKQVGDTSGRDVPDGPKEDSTSQDVPLSAGSDADHVTGSYTMQIHAQQLRSQISVELDRSLQMLRTTAAGQKILNTTIKTTVTVDFCPDAGGRVPVHARSEYTLVTDTDTTRVTIDGTFTGQVDGNGDLAAVTGSATLQGGVTSGGSTADNYNLAVSGLAFGVAGATAGRVSGGHYDGQADSAQLADTKATLAKVDLENSIPTIVAAAENVWQNNGCVIVLVPDYNYMAQPGSDNYPRKEVDADSKSTFQVVVHHRFEHTDLSLPVQQRLSTEKSVDPQRVSPTPGSASYLAPNKRDVSNDDDLRAWSQRGRSDLTIEFRTKNPPFKMSLTGTITETAGLVTVKGTIKVPVTEFSETSEGDHFEFEADLPVTVSVSMTVQGVPLACGAVAETERGTVHLQAVTVPIDDTHLGWQVKEYPASAHFTSKSNCVIDVGNYLQSTGAGFGAKFFAALGNFQVPVEPGATTVTGTSAGAGISDSVSAKVTVYPTQP